jgi:hypothetical protein
LAEIAETTSSRSAATASTKIGGHFCFGNAWGNDLLSGAFPEGYQTVLPHFFDTPGIDEFVLDYANRNMAGSSS